MPYRVSPLPYPHYIQVIHDKLLLLVNESSACDSISRLREIGKQIDELANLKKQILDAMRKHYDRRTFAQLFFEWYYEEDE